MASWQFARIINIEKGSVKVYRPDFFKFILEKSMINDKIHCHKVSNNYDIKVIKKMNEPYSSFCHDENNETMVFDVVEDSANPDKILPYIYEKESKKSEKPEISFLQYEFRGDKNEKYKIHSERNIDFFNIFDEPYMKIKSDNEKDILCAIFSQDGSHAFKDLKDEKSQPYAKINDKGESIFYQPKRVLKKNEAVRYIQKARDKVFALFAFNNFPIVIKITGAKIDPKYFINVWKSPFIRYPELYRTIAQEENVFYYSSYTNLDQKEVEKGNDVVSLEYVEMPKIVYETKPFNIQLPLTIVQKTEPTYPDYEKWENLPLDSFLPIYYRFSQIIEQIRSEYYIKVDKTNEYVNVASFIELGYTPMNTCLPKMESSINIKDTSENFLSYLNQEKNVSSIMEIASKITQSLFLPLEPGGVQILKKDGTKTRYIAFYTRNKNSIMANANAIAAGLRTSNYLIVPVTPSHVSHFLESLDCALLNWTRFGLTKYNLCYRQGGLKSADEIPKTKMIIYFEPGQRPFDAEISIRNIKYHCSKYDNILDIEFIRNLEKLKEIITFNDDEDLNICQLELLYSIAAFATVNDCADYLELDDSYEAKSSFAFSLTP